MACTSLAEAARRRTVVLCDRLRHVRLSVRSDAG